MQKPISLFISKNTDEIHSLHDFCEKKSWNLIAKSCISLRLIETSDKIETEFVFFGSKNAFDIYLESGKNSNLHKICCVGEVTKAYIEKKGFEVVFCGKNAGNVEEISKALNLFLANKSICFVQSSASKKTIQKHITTSQIQELVLYETNFSCTKFKDVFDVYVFTSPSNIDAFLVHNTIKPNAKIIAWGKTTEKALLENGVKPNFILKNSSIQELIDFLKIS
jgi:uroporphyrinogen-III synthase